MTNWQVILAMAAAGSVGGVLAALLQGEAGLLLPTKEPHPSGTVIKPGAIGLVVIGALAAALSYALYGPLTDSTVLGRPQARAVTGNYGLTLGQLAGAVLVGVGGSRWLDGHVDKILLRGDKVQLHQGARVLASVDADHEKAEQIATATPKEVLEIAQSMRTPQTQTS